MWPDILAKAKEGGADVVQTYVFWDGHEPQPGMVQKPPLLFFCFIAVPCSHILPWIKKSNSQKEWSLLYQANFEVNSQCTLMGVQYNFNGRYDLPKFVKLVAEAGMYLHLRIGPYVCAEWNFGFALVYQNPTPWPTTSLLIGFPAVISCHEIWLLPPPLSLNLPIHFLCCGTERVVLPKGFSICLFAKCLGTGDFQCGCGMFQELCFALTINHLRWSWNPGISPCFQIQIMGLCYKTMTKKCR
jgi:hypothetical protein